MWGGACEVLCGIVTCVYNFRGGGNQSFKFFTDFGTLGCMLRLKTKLQAMIGRTGS